jgi:exopolyphosphatase/guanosine-5'-triphosphate,3'-diphosphate pyrophosphatase
MILATVDVGSNTAKLLVAAPDPDAQSFRALYEERRHVRLGEGVDASGAVNPAAQQRLLDALAAFDAQARQLGADGLSIAATSASRDATNKLEIQAAVRSALGADYAILSGLEEARLSLLGALSGVPHVTGPAVVIDIGGGSTELAGTDSDGREVAFTTSLDVGSVRLTERCFSSQPVPGAEREAARHLIRQALEQAELPSLGTYDLVGAAGTTGALARLHVGFDAWSQAPAGPIVLTREQVRDWSDRLARMTYEQTLALNPHVMANRADIIAAGVLVLEVAMDVLGFDTLTISSRGLRHGLMLDLIGRLR